MKKYLILIVAILFLYADFSFAQLSKVAELVAKLNEKESLLVELKQEKDVAEATKNAVRLVPNKESLPQFNIRIERKRQLDNVTNKIYDLQKEIRSLKGNLIKEKIINLTRTISLEELKALQQKAIKFYKSVEVEGKASKTFGFSEELIDELNDAYSKVEGFDKAVTEAEKANRGLFIRLGRWWNHGRGFVPKSAVNPCPISGNNIIPNTKSSLVPKTSVSLDTAKTALTFSEQFPKTCLVLKTGGKCLVFAGNVMLGYDFAKLLYDLSGEKAQTETDITRFNFNMLEEQARKLVRDTALEELKRRGLNERAAIELVTSLDFRRDYIDPIAKEIAQRWKVDYIIEMEKKRQREKEQQRLSTQPSF